MSIKTDNGRPVTTVAMVNPGGGVPEVKLSGSNLRHAEAVTPDDDNDLAGVATYGAACAVYVGATGDVVVTVGETDVTFASLAAGMWHPMPPFTRVKESSDATGIVAGY